MGVFVLSKSWSQPELTRRRLPAAYGTREDFVERLELFVIQLDFQRMDVFLKLLHGARSDDGRGDGRLCEQPRQHNVGGVFAHFQAECLVTLQLVAVFIDTLLQVGVGAATLINLLEDATEQTTRQRNSR